MQIGTTSLDAVNSEIKPSNQPQVFNTSNDVVSAFKIHRVDAIVVDLATAFELTSTELPHTTIAGQFSAPGGGDHWGVLLSKGSALTPCVDRAVQRAVSRRHAGVAQPALDRVGAERAGPALSGPDASPAPAA